MPGPLSRWIVPNKGGSHVCPAASENRFLGASLLGMTRRQQVERPMGAVKKSRTCGTKQLRNRALHVRELYSKPEERKRVTGSTIGMGSLLKIQRATANPNAA
jgi:hypothetical protein